MDFDPENKKISKWTSVNSRIFNMYKNSFNRIVPGTLKEIEFNSFKKLEKVSNFRGSSLFNKTPKSSKFIKNHVSLTPGTKIVDLPMSPFGKHVSYNEEAEFKKKHFLGACSAENRNLEKQIRLLRKKISYNLKNVNVGKKGYFRTHQFMDVFKTNGGNLFSSVVEERSILDRIKMRKKSRDGNREREVDRGKFSQSLTLKSLNSLAKSSIFTDW